MNPLDTITIVPCLREREAAWVTVWECEERLRSLLPGVAFPLPPPPALPSQRRRARRPARRPETHPVVRALRPGEDAYRLVLRQDGAETTVLTDDHAALTALLAGSGGPPPELLALETVALAEGGEPTRVQGLFPPPAGDPAPDPL